VDRRGPERAAKGTRHVTNLFHLPTGAKSPDLVNAIIEVPMGSSNKYEYDSELGVFRLDRVLYSPMHYPGDYGFIPGTYAEDDDPLDVLVLMNRATFPGAVLLALIGILPGLIQLAFGMTQGFAMFFGGTSLLIMVGVILDTLQQIETQLMMRQYDGLMKSGRIQGRQSASAVQI